MRGRLSSLERGGTSHLNTTGLAILRRRQLLLPHAGYCPRLWVQSRVAGKIGSVGFVVPLSGGVAECERGVFGDLAGGDRGYGGGGGGSGGYGAPGGGGGGAAGGPGGFANQSFRNGDWNCPSCSAHNFGVHRSVVI